mmetsp:Transcript_7216/g.16514  ORF Transcript_7216/g.16514 Transcript_7216/m.16514 type:complete len:206 (+) Transcript_7216:348-965(+)
MELHARRSSPTRGLRFLASPIKSLKVTRPRFLGSRSGRRAMTCLGVRSTPMARSPAASSVRSTSSAESGSKVRKMRAIDSAQVVGFGSISLVMMVFHASSFPLSSWPSPCSQGIFPSLGFRCSTASMNSCKLITPSLFVSSSSLKAITCSELKCTPMAVRPELISIMSSSPEPSRSKFLKRFSIVLAQSSGLLSTFAKTAFQMAC